MMSEFTVTRDTLRTFDPLANLAAMSPSEVGGWVADILAEETGLDTARDYPAEEIAAAKVSVHLAERDFSEAEVAAVREWVASKVRSARR